MDFAKPITPGDAVRFAAEQAHAKAKVLRAEARELIARAEALEEHAYNAESDADRFDKYQSQAPDNHGQDGDGGHTV